MSPTVALAMIVRNEEAYLPACLERARNAVDEVVIVDTGSRDRTVEIARRYTSKVYHYPWQDDFAAARNYALEHVDSEWVLCLDADELLDTTDGDLRSLVADAGGCEAFFLPLHNLTGETSGDFQRFPVLRLFRNRPEYRFRGPIHEQVILERRETVGVATAPVIWHRPLSGRERRRKRGRNLGLLRRALAADPDNPFLLYYLGVEWLGLGRAARALPCFERVRRELTDGHLLFRAPAVRYLVACLRALERYDEALCVCLEESLRYPEYTDLFFDGGVLFEEKGEYEVAIKWFQEALNCGRPPLLFAHTNGTEGFLSLYHLGYCHEKLGRTQKAREFYERALAANPAYPYPLYSLFLLLFTTAGPKAALDYFRTAGHLGHPERAAILADLFFEAGHPELADAALKDTATEGRPDGHTRLAHLCVYAGRPDEARSLIRGLREAGTCPDPQLVTDEAVALILKGDYPAARAAALSLWRRPEARHRALALLGLLSRLAGGPGRCRPEKPREPEVAAVLLDVLEKCLRHPPGTPAYPRLAGEIMAFLLELSPQGVTALCYYLEKKAGALRHLLADKYGPAGRFVP
jgi:glycosyltransferase involved in cell wall biosynthesis